MTSGTPPPIVAYRPDRYASEGRTYVVLGAPRGGTSLVAGALQILGVPMGSVDATHEDPAFHDETNIQGMKGTIAYRNKVHVQWGWKLPNTIHYYRLIAYHVRNPVFVVVYRNPFDIFMSASAKGGELSDVAFNAPAYHYATMHELIHDLSSVPTYVLSYEMACAAPLAFAEALGQILYVPPGADAVSRCAAFIDPAIGYRVIT